MRAKGFGMTITDLSGKRLVVGVSGASGAILGVRLLQVLQGSEVETHLVVSKWGARTLIHETPFTLEQAQAFATTAYSHNDQGAPIASGSFHTNGMVVVPCSARTLSCIAQGAGDNLIHRAADVTLKERRRLVLVVRETPLSDIHLENMLRLSRMGVVIFPPVPAFYNHPCTLEDVIGYTVTRVLDQFDIHLAGARRWDGVMSTAKHSAEKLPEELDLEKS